MQKEEIGQDFRFYARRLDRSETRNPAFENVLREQLYHLLQVQKGEYATLNLHLTDDPLPYSFEVTLDKNGNIVDRVPDSDVATLSLVEKDIKAPIGDVITDETPAVSCGILKVYKRREQITTNDDARAGIASNAFGSDVLAWRRELYDLIRHGYPPNVAFYLQLNKLDTDYVGDIASTFCDVAGYTRITEAVHIACQKAGLKRSFIMPLVSDFVGVYKKIAGSYGLCHDKVVGDCVVSHAGPPFLKDGKNGYGSDAKTDTILYALNSFKTTLALHNARNQIQEAFNHMILSLIQALKELGQDPVSSRTTRRISHLDETQQNAIKIISFCRRFSMSHRVNVSQGIATGSAEVGLLTEKGERAHSASYTALGDVVNKAARLQGSAQAGEIVIDERTKTLIEEYVQGSKTGVPVLTDEKGSIQTFDQFKEQLLGDGTHDSELTISFEPTILELKNKLGYELAYYVVVTKVSNTLTLETPHAEDDLRRIGGRYWLKNMNKMGSRKRDFEFINQLNPDHTFHLALKKTKKQIRYVPNWDYEQRATAHQDHALIVENGELVEIEYKKIEEKIDEALAAATGHDRLGTKNSPGDVPHTIYNYIQRDGGDDEEKVFDITRNNKTIPSLTVPVSQIQPLTELPLEYRSLFDVYRKDTDENVHYDSSKPILFVHSTGVYIGNESDIH